MSQLIMPTLLLLLSLTTAGSGQRQIRVDIVRMPDHRDDGRLRLECRASGLIESLSVRLYCPVGLGSPGQPVQVLCFENCARTKACSADTFCSTAECNATIAPEEQLKRFGYVFQAFMQQRPGSNNFTFECRYGWRSSELVMANWRPTITTTAGLSQLDTTSAVRPTARTLTTIQKSSSRLEGAAAPVTPNFGTTTATNDADSTMQTGSPPLIDKTVVYVVGFAAVGMLSAAVLTVGVVFWIVRRRRHSPRGGNSAEQKVAEEANSPLMTEMRQRPDLLPASVD